MCLFLKVLFRKNRIYFSIFFLLFFFMGRPSVISLVFLGRPSVILTTLTTQTTTEKHVNEVCVLTKSCGPRAWILISHSGPSYSNLSHRLGFA